MKIWLDDFREMPVFYDTRCENASEAINLIMTGEVTHISFDHDLGRYTRTGYDVAKIIESLAYEKMIPRIKWAIHTANPRGRMDIELAMKSADRFWDLTESENHSIITSKEK